MTNEGFREFTNLANDISKLLQSHFVALQWIMTPIGQAAHGERPSNNFDNFNDGTTARWLFELHSNIQPLMLKYYEWPISVENEARQGGLVRRGIVPVSDRQISA